MKATTDTYTGNIGLWFYRSFFNEYFKPETPPESNEKVFAPWLKKQVDPVLNSNWGVYKDNFEADEMNSFADTKFQLTTIYPGLVCGIGYEHELTFTNEFKLGFSFDHTTGLPYIPGSSVKGTLRSAFKHNGYPKSILEDWIEAINNSSSGKTYPKELIDEEDKSKELNEKLKILEEQLKKVVENIDWEKLERNIFEGKPYSGDKPLNSYETNVFFDAFISKNENDNDFFLADDYITCHQNNKHPELSPFTNPNPVRFLKVRSDVEFTFGFRLSDTDIGEGISFSKDFKRELFKQILLDLGIGAKTNVGYGQFVQ